MMTSSNSKVRQGMDLIDSMDPAELDELVDYIRSTFKMKRTQANARAQAELRVGDRVELTGSYKPQYLRGLTGIVEAKRNTRVGVKLDCGPVGKFRSGTVITTPAGLTVIN